MNDPLCGPSQRNAGSSASRRETCPKMSHQTSSISIPDKRPRQQFNRIADDPVSIAQRQCNAGTRAICLSGKQPSDGHAVLRVGVNGVGTCAGRKRKASINGRNGFNRATGISTLCYLLYPSSAPPLTGKVQPVMKRALEDKKEDRAIRNHIPVRARAEQVDIIQVLPDTGRVRLFDCTTSPASASRLQRDTQRSHGSRSAHSRRPSP